MRLSTSTNIYFNRPEGKTNSIEKIIRSCSQAGYRVMDMNYYDCTSYKTDLTTDRWWKSWINRIYEAAQKCNVEFSQAHANFYNFCDKKTPDKEFLDSIVYRCVECSEILGVKWLVIHAGTAFDSPMLVKESKRRNLEYFHPLLDFAAEHNVGIAIENLWDLNIAPKRRYTTTAEELVDLVDTLAESHDNVGICWDTEHAEIMHQDQLSALRLVGDRLKATHISDFTSISNDHILPFYGLTDWDTVCRALKEIKYDGDFTYEIHHYLTHVPDEQVDDALAYSVKVGNALINKIIK